MSTNNAAHTQWRYEELHDGRESLGLRVYHGDDIACSIFGCGVADFDNARLFTEAGTVVHETGLTPRQLAEQRAELLEALRGIMHYAGMGASVCDVYTKEEPAFIAAYAAIAKATGSAA